MWFCLGHNVAVHKKKILVGWFSYMRKAGLIATVVVGVVGLPCLPSAGADIQSGLIAHWRFDETSGIAAADSSGNGNNASLANFPTDSAPWIRGRIGGALWFNARGNDDLAITDQTIELENQNEIAFAFWLTRKEGAPTANPHIIVPVSTHWVIWNPGRGIGFHNTAANVDPPVNVWSHYVVAFSRENT